MHRTYLINILYTLFYSICLFSVSCSVIQSDRIKEKKSILVFTKTAGFRHASIPEGAKAIQRLGTKNGFLVDTTSDSQKFTGDNLEHYAAVVFVSTTGDLLNEEQKKAFISYIQSGGGFVGIHAAADAEYSWEWYGGLVGAYFQSHPQQQDARLIIHKDRNFPVTRNLPDPWTRRDEWYNYHSAPSDVHVLVELDEGSYEGGNMNGYHPIVWYHNYDGGRAFYIGLGHTEESYYESDFLELLYDGIRFSMGENKG